MSRAAFAVIASNSDSGASAFAPAFALRALRLARAQRSRKRRAASIGSTFQDVDGAQRAAAFKESVMAPRKPTTTSVASQTPAAPVAATPAPTPSPAPDPNAALVAAAQQAVATLVGAEATLGVGDAPLTSADKRRSTKLRKGGEKYVAQIGNLAKQYQLETPAMQVVTMLTLLGKATALQPVLDQLTIFLKHVSDSVFAAQSQAWDMALQYYAMLHRRAKTSGDLATSLQPIADFLAYRHPSTKAPPGSPTTRQVAAAKKAQKALTTVAAGSLATTNLLDPRKRPALPTRSPAPTPAPSPTPAPVGNGAPPAGASSSSSSPNGGTPPATHS
jgi:hypothetical protein